MVIYINDSKFSSYIMTHKVQCHAYGVYILYTDSNTHPIYKNLYTLTWLVAIV